MNKQWPDSSLFPILSNVCKTGDRRPNFAEIIPRSASIGRKINVLLTDNWSESQQIVLKEKKKNPGSNLLSAPPTLTQVFFFFWGHIRVYSIPQLLLLGENEFFFLPFVGKKWSRVVIWPRFPLPILSNGEKRTHRWKRKIFFRHSSFPSLNRKARNMNELVRL